MNETSVIDLDTAVNGHKSLKSGDSITGLPHVVQNGRKTTTYVGNFSIMAVSDRSIMGYAELRVTRGRLSEGFFSIPLLFRTMVINSGGLAYDHFMLDGEPQTRYWNEIVTNACAQGIELEDSVLEHVFPLLHLKLKQYYA